MNRHMHFIGIGGIGMSGIAQLYLEKGLTITGSDLRLSPIVERLISLGAKVYIGHNPSNVEGADTIVYSSAIKPDNPELIEATRLNIPVLRRAQALAELMQEKLSITVTGAHGKTTTTSMISNLLEESGLCPTVAVGGIINNFSRNAWLGEGKFFVAEADESDGSFLYYNPTYSIVTNIDYEHLDYYVEFKRLLAAFKDFMNKTHDSGAIVCCLDDPHIRAIVQTLNKRCIGFGISNTNDIYPKDVRLEEFSSDFECIYKTKTLGRFSLSIPGLFNISNALAVVALGMELGIGVDKIRQSLAAYKGAERRLQIKLDSYDIRIIDDYAHHPTEIKATLEAVRPMKYNRLLVVFQPHRYTRLKLLFDEFTKVLGNTQHLILTDIYAASEPPITGITAQALYTRIKDAGHRDVNFIPKTELCDFLMTQTKSGDLILFLGAGDINRIADELAQQIKATVERQCPV